ncbi:tetratricopeptide repeat protein, partial [Candidatus Chloroploca sp. M-50]
HAALTLFQAVGDRLGEANCLIGCGKVRLIEGKREEADQLLQQALALYQAIGDRWSIAAQTANYGWALHHRNQPAAARSYFARAADLFAVIGSEDRVQKYQQLAAEQAATEG